MPENRKAQDQLQQSSMIPNQPSNPHDQHLYDLEVHEANMAAFCGIWEDHPRHQFRMKFCIETGQLVGYSNAGGGKALAVVDGRSIQMVIIHSKENNHSSLDNYRGVLSSNQKYIEWEKQDASRKNGWRPTRKWIKIQ